MTATVDLDDRLTHFRSKRGIGTDVLLLVNDLALSGRSHDAQRAIRDAFEFDRGTAAHQLGVGWSPDYVDWGTPAASERLWATVGEASGIPGTWEEAWPQLCQLALEGSSRTGIRLQAADELIHLERERHHAPPLPLLVAAASWGHVEAALFLGHHYRQHAQPLAAASWFCRAAEIDRSLSDDYIGSCSEYDRDDLPWTLEDGCRDARLLGELIAAASPDDAQRIARLATDRTRKALPPLPDRVEELPAGYPPPEGTPLLAPANGAPRAP